MHSGLVLHSACLASYKGDNILDLVMSNEEGLVENLTVGEPFGTSDHYVIKWNMVIKKIRNKNCNRVIFDYFNVDYAQLKEVSQEFDWSEIINGCNVEDDWVALRR